MDVAFFVEPGRGVVQHVKVKGYYVFGARRGAFLLAGGGRPPVQDEEDEEDETQKKKVQPAAFKDGLPVRKKQNQNVMQFNVTFEDAAGAKPLQLDARTKRLLGWKD